MLRDGASCDLAEPVRNLQGQAILKNLGPATRWNQRLKSIVNKGDFAARLIALVQRVIVANCQEQSAYGTRW